jgi:hypothetical protein
LYKETITQKNEIDVIIEIIIEALETLPPYRVAIGMRRKTLSENGDKNTRSETERIVPQQGGLLEKIRGKAEENDDQTCSTAFDFTAA